MSLKRHAEILRQWVSEKALPYWAEHGRDPEGGFYEDLDLDGRPRRDIVRRFRVQARQIYVYALATERGWHDGRDIVKRGYDFLIEKGFEHGGEPGFIHLLNADYSVHDPKRDLYDHAFFLLAALWATQSVDHPTAEKTQRVILDFLEIYLRSNAGGWLESRPDQLPRRQNPHMHLFETSLNGLTLTNDPIWRDMADEILDLFQTRFFDPKTRTVSEYFDQNWQLIDGATGQTAEPGHAAEWVWLLSWYERLTENDTSTYIGGLYGSIKDRPGPFLNDEEDKSGNMRRATKRLWCQTELIKAHLSQAERGVPGAPEKAAEVLEIFRSTYLKDDGTWVDQIDETGQACAKTIPASTFYHIVCMIAELERVSRL